MFKKCLKNVFLYRLKKHEFPYSGRKSDLFLVTSQEFWLLASIYPV